MNVFYFANEVENSSFSCIFADKFFRSFRNKNVRKPSQSAMQMRHAPNTSKISQAPARARI